jgi:CheY-like chemotaxis protein
MEVLWIDDDTPPGNVEVGGFVLHSAQNLAQAERILDDGKVKPGGVVVDLYVPQAGWGGKLLEIPGIEYISHLRKRLGPDVKVAAFSVLVSEAERERIRKAGAVDAFRKGETSLLEVVERLRSSKDGEGEANV